MKFTRLITNEEIKNLYLSVAFTDFMVPLILSHVIIPTIMSNFDEINANLIPFGLLYTTLSLELQVVFVRIAHNKSAKKRVNSKKLNRK